MAKRKFIATVQHEILVTFDDTEMPEGIVPNDEWRSHFYKIYTPEELAAHLAYNYSINNIDRLSRLDGWADCSDDEVEFVSLDAWVDVSEG